MSQSELSFGALRRANCARMPLFKNRKGEPAHSKPDGSDWSPAQWLQALAGELGEYANVRKKFERGDFDEATFKKEAAKELADVQTYLDILAYQLGIDLGQATMDKWNEASERIGCPLWLEENDWVVDHDKADDEFYSTILPRDAFVDAIDHETWNEIPQ